MTMSSRGQINSSERRVLIVDAPPEVQSWVDSFIISAHTGAGNFPHPHPDIPAATLTLAELEQVVRTALGSLPWGEGAAISGGEVGAARPHHDPEHDTDPSTGSAYHNLLHSMLGDFH